jgi:fructose-1,6-bisphosphatase/inositol monophosphatase family enzyme
VGGSDDDLALAAALVRDAGLLAARMLSDGLRTEQKTSVSDVVSAADRAAENLIAERLAGERPGDGIVGEEGTRQSGARTWYVDPVDGTYNFLSGVPLWCSALALADQRGAVLGAVYCPVTDELWTGGRGRPTELNGDPVSPLEDAALRGLSVATYLHPTTLPDATARRPLLRVMEGAATVRMLGSGSLELAAVASGRLGIWAQIDVLPWDWLPGSALVVAAGGAAEVRHVDGHRWHVAGNRRAVEDVLGILEDQS